MIVRTIRHSSTAHNAARIISGRLDEPLSAEGRGFARELVARIGHQRADRIIASPMCRAVETATILVGYDAGVIEQDPLCVERSYGLLEGLSPDEVRSYADQIEYVEVGGIAHSLNPPGGEPFESVRSRAEAFVASLHARPVNSVLVVSHQVFLQQLHGLLLGLDIRASLGLDIKGLQTDEFDLARGLPATRRPIDPGIQTLISW